MQVSIIIPALNEVARIQDTLLPLQPGRLIAGHEVILVDGGSSDGTTDAVIGLADKILVNEPGRALQMIAGATVATGDILWFLHADTIPDEKSLFTIIRAVESAGTKNIWGRFNVKIDAPDRWFRVIETTMNWRSRFTAVATGDQGIFITRDLYAEVGGFNVLPLMEDIEISKRLRGKRKPLCLSETLTTSARRWQKAGIFKTMLHMWFIRLAYVAGVTPARLARWYYPQVGVES